MSKKRNDKESMICLTPKLSQSLFVYCIQRQRKGFFFYRKRASYEKGKVKEWAKNGMKAFFIALATAIKKNPTPSKRKDANELKVYEKTVGAAIKQD